APQPVSDAGDPGIVLDLEAAAEELGRLEIVVVQVRKTLRRIRIHCPELHEPERLRLQIEAVGIEPVADRLQPGLTLQFAPLAQDALGYAALEEKRRPGRVEANDDRLDQHDRCENDEGNGGKDDLEGTI